MLNLTVWLLVGGLVGWVASLLMGSDRHQGLWLNIVAGMAGAALAGWWLSPLVGIASVGNSGFSIGALGVALLGAIGLLALANLIRRAALH
jgi:uncharacterized membrane protein YeaQ/YmgE (transglycosylase-associated protein family)